VKRILLSLLVLLTATSLAAEESAPLPADVQAISWLGDTLRVLPLDTIMKSSRGTKLTKAKMAMEKNPDGADELLALGKAHDGMGDYREGIAIYTEGMERFPDDARFPRRRGHRWTTLRDLDRAFADLDLAETLAIELAKQSAEARPAPVTDRLRYDIEFHLGLAHYLRGDLEDAENRFRSALTWTDGHNEWRVSTLNWLSLTLCRAGKTAEIDELLAEFPTTMRLKSGQSYFRLLQMYSGRLREGELLPGLNPKAVSTTTTLYGLGQWRACDGDLPGATELMDRVIESGFWSSFGFLASEAMLARDLRLEEGE